LQPLQKLAGYFALIFITATTAPEQYLCIAGSEARRATTRQKARYFDGG
jgi:hypothetical protein